MKNIASIDIGTNSVLYSLFRIKGGKIAEEIYFERHSPRIGSRLAGGKRPVITDESYKKLEKILSRSCKHALRQGAEQVLIAATNPLRLAQNGHKIRQRLESELGYDIIILTPKREAYLSFLGAVGELRQNRTALVVDMGGGSTELVVYRGEKRLAFVSLPEGAVSLTERFKSTGKVDPGQFQLFEDYLSRYGNRLDCIRPYLNFPIRLVGGTSTALAYLKDEKILQKPNGINLNLNEINRFTWLLASLNLTCRRQLLGIDKKRAEIIFAGAFWYGYLFKILNINRAVATPRGLRHGMALDFVRRGIFTA